ncbi:MarR family winged helix-turn-helix transcriptional regulator [Paraburkholderia sp. BR13439]|uniref:MarR family winged helix-turn-helix transcriptional regulator n=1 Tax=Paraburkholderia TaxID=1822464 RepID=UPI0034CFFFE7
MNKDVTTYDQRARVGRLLHRSENRLVVALGKELEPFGVTAAQYVILAALRYHRADTAAYLCKELSYTPGAMTRMIDRLEQKLLVRRVPHPDSRRANKLELTAHGRALFPELLAASTAIIDRFFGGYSASELALLESLLKGMLSHQ